MLKDGFNKLHAKFKHSVGEVAALEAQLQASKNETADLRLRAENAEFQARLARERTEAARNVSIELHPLHPQTDSSQEVPQRVGGDSAGAGHSLTHLRLSRI